MKDRGQTSILNFIVVRLLFSFVRSWLFRLQKKGLGESERAKQKSERIFGGWDAGCGEVPSWSSLGFRTFTTGPGVDPAGEGALAAREEDARLGPRRSRRRAGSGRFSSQVAEAALLCAARSAGGLPGVAPEPRLPGDLEAEGGAGGRSRSRAAARSSRARMGRLSPGGGGPAGPGAVRGGRRRGARPASPDAPARNSASAESGRRSPACFVCRSHRPSPAGRTAARMMSGRFRLPQERRELRPAPRLLRRGAVAGGGRAPQAPDDLSGSPLAPLLLFFSAREWPSPSSLLPGALVAAGGRGRLPCRGWSWEPNFLGGHIRDCRRGSCSHAEPSAALPLHGLAQVLRSEVTAPPARLPLVLKLDSDCDRCSCPCRSRTPLLSGSRRNRFRIVSVTRRPQNAGNVFKIIGNTLRCSFHQIFKEYAGYDWKWSY